VRALQISTILISGARLPLLLSARRLFSTKFSTKQAGIAIGIFQATRCNRTTLFTRARSFAVRPTNSTGRAQREYLPPRRGSDLIEFDDAARHAVRRLDSPYVPYTATWRIRNRISRIRARNAARSHKSRARRCARERAPVGACFTKFHCRHAAARASSESPCNDSPSYMGEGRWRRRGKARGGRFTVRRGEFADYMRSFMPN